MLMMFSNVESFSKFSRIEMKFSMGNFVHCIYVIAFISVVVVDDTLVVVNSLYIVVHFGLHLK